MGGVPITIAIILLILSLNLSVLPKQLREQGGRNPGVATLAGAQNLLLIIIMMTS